MNWLATANDVRKEADKSQLSAKRNMILHHSAKHLASVYNVGDEVLVRNPNSHSQKRKRNLDEPNGYKGQIIQKRRNRYKVTAETETFMRTTSGYCVGDITSFTPEEKRKRRKLNRQP